MSIKKIQLPPKKRGRGRPRQNPRDRFRRKVKVLDNDCWRWIGGTVGGRIRQTVFWVGDGRALSVLSASKFLFDPDGFDGLAVDRTITQTCSTEDCVQPGHLVVVKKEKRKGAVERRLKSIETVEARRKEKAMKVKKSLPALQKAKAAGVIT